MKKQCFVYGIIFILLSILLGYSLFYASAEHFLSTIILCIVCILAGAISIISGVTGKAPFTGKELKTAPVNPKKQYNIKNTFIITGIIQALFLALYAIALLLIPFMPTLPPQIHFQFAATLSVIPVMPVMPVCLIWNTLALCYVLDISQKREKEGRKWLYVILSSLIMLVAWVIYIGVWISLTGGV